MSDGAARCYAMMADAPGEIGVLLFGGWEMPERDSPYLGMAAFDPSRGWTTLPAGPIPEPGDVFGYDHQSDRAVFVEVAGETWGFDPAAPAWEKREPGMTPPAHGARIAYDSGSDRLITFGGDNFSGPLFDDTWAYDYESDSWTKLDPVRRPSARSYYAMAYDGGSDRIILFGGGAAVGDLADTWAFDYDRNEWTALTAAAGPEARSYSAMAYDAKTDRIILFGGVTGASEDPRDDTWTYDLETDAWTKLEGPGPSARGWHVLAADQESGKLVLFGGGPSRADCTADTWIFDPSTDTWSQPG